MADRDLEFLFNHIFLPPRVPYSSESQNGAGERALGDRIAQLGRHFRDLSDTQFYQQWSTLCHTLDTFARLHRNNSSLSKTALRRAFREIKDGGIVILHVAVQNSGLLIRKAGREYIIESFEASPPAAEVLAAHKAIRWDFPSRAVAVPSSTFEDDLFESSLTEFLEKASVEPVKQFAATSHKAGSFAFESRDTPTPAIVGQLLMAILEANGRKHSAVLTRKRIRDEVCWSDGAENPWRRSAAWLVLRVGLQRSLCFLLGGSIGTIHYKFFMCFVISSVSRDICLEGLITVDRLAFARTKLARRVAKLKQNLALTQPKMAEPINAMFSWHEKQFTDALQTTSQRLREEWTLTRARVTKRVLRLPKRADPESLILSLSNCRVFLQKILEEALYGRQPVQLRLENRPQRVTHYSTWAKKSLTDTSSVLDYLDLADVEAKLHLDVMKHISTSQDSNLNQTCTRLMQRMFQYQGVACTAYKSDPENLSLMLITLMEIWQALDSTALKLYPLLADYDPGFPHDILYTLQIAQLADMQRLQNVERYLRHRHNTAQSTLPSIFSEASQSSFAVRYFDQCPQMLALFDMITSMDENTREQKEHEWGQKSSEYETILKEAAETTCLFVEDRHDPSKRRHDDVRCRKHFLERKAGKMNIQIHEALLPKDVIQAKVVVFELILPQGFAAWRDSTWQLLQLARRQTLLSGEPKVSLQDYPGLRPYFTPTACVITLASYTKSFHNTHYSHVRFPTPLDQVCLPHGLKYGLHDRSQGLWAPRHLQKPSFAELLAAKLSAKSVYAPLQRYFYPTLDEKNISANEVVASQTRCPNTLTLAEFTAFQDLRLGCGIQWMRLLTELASSNLNFGTVEVGTLVNALALVAGPPDDQNPLRANHWVFRDPHFCKALAAQIRKRLESVSTNWREGQTVECMLTLLQRLWSLTSSLESKGEAESLLLYVRKMTHEWTRLLRREICNATDVETAQKRSRDALLATLLCRKTFMIEAEKPNNLLEPDALACFLECLFTLKDNLSTSETGYIGRMSTYLRKLFISDIKLLRRLEIQLRLSIQATQNAVNAAVNSVWAEAEGDSARAFTPWTFLESPHNGWVTAQTISADGLLVQNIHFDLFEGALLIDGQKLGRLPDEYTRQEFFQQLFGTRVFMTYPSSIPGMSYMLASLVHEHQIHFGYRDGIHFMRARSARKTLELIPHTVFLASNLDNAPDLPLPLIHGSVHWLDLESRCVEIRPQGTMWQSKYSDWKIGLWTNQAFRREALLVDPRSSVFRRVATIIEPFEHRSNIIISQPQRSNLVLHLPGLELSFRVNSEGLLESQQLRAIVDSNQDAGTLYGLESSLVLRDSIVSEDRSVIVAMGPAKLEKNGHHVKIRINHTGYYARFFINTILGRLECASEPRLIYFKAYCHAITAFVLADPLTRRTGTDEAIHCLQAGNAQPWAPLDGETYRMLSSIGDLTPQRNYYPERLKVLQKINWKDSITSAAQHDDFYPIIKDILQQCSVLQGFYQSGQEPPAANAEKSDEHLLVRAQTRNQQFRALQHQTAICTASDRVYVARDCTKSPSAKNAFDAAILLKQWSRRIDVTRNLIALLQQWPVIQGYVHGFELFLFTDLINIDLASNWGSIFKLCQDASEAKDKFKLMFLFATMSFDSQVDMTVIRSLIAVSIMDEFKALLLPECPNYYQFRREQVPSVEFLARWMMPYRVPYPEDERALLSFVMHSKQRRKLEMAQSKHEKQSEDSSKEFARHLLSQWPCREPSGNDLKDLALLDSEQALSSIKPEWARLVDNYEFFKHLKSVQEILNKCRFTKESVVPPVGGDVEELFPVSVISHVALAMRDLLRKLLNYSMHAERGISINDYLKAAKTGQTMTNALPIESQVIPENPALVRSVDSSSPQGNMSAVIAELKGIISAFAGSEDLVRQTYAKDLQRSIHALLKLQNQTLKETSAAVNHFDRMGLETMISESRAVVQTQFDTIRRALTRDDWWLEAGALLPDLTPVTLLETLSTFAVSKTFSVARDVIIRYGESITNLQHLLRIQGALQRNDTIQLGNETGTEGHAEWRSKDHPDWLLLEIDFNILIRKDQHEVARAMISPNNSTNFVLQLNMGQGKSSVIIPMVVSQLANAKNLVRVVVPRPLLLQTAQLLQSRLGGLIGRKIKHIPFSRKSSTTLTNIECYRNLHQDVLQSQGVILTLPEHMLSFQLSGLQELSNGHMQQAASMMRLQAWLGRNCRDILDECDHMLAVKTQLIYPSGAQSMVDGHPSRWKVVQRLLKLVKVHLGSLRRQFPKSIQVIERSAGTFPTIYLLNQDVKDALMYHLTNSVVKGDEGILPIDGCSPDELDSVKIFLRNAQFPKTTALKVAGVFRNNPDARQQILLLRGLIIHRILLMGLSKRWNVQYGIHPHRDPIAVPFRSKGIPSDQAEFGHPDVSILLTCLSFYYSGLSLPQFKQSLHLLLSADEPVREYESWINDIKSFPDSLRSWNSINIDDEGQCTQIWNRLRQQMTVIDFFLNQCVFPRHARTFERKLVSSGWDIATPIDVSSNENPVVMKENRKPAVDAAKPILGASTSLTVGFSGTNDNKILLPLNVLQNDLPGLLHTNAEVLTYLLQPRNRRYFPVSERGMRLSEMAFLQKLQRHGIRMLLDAGAQILELDNVSLAQTWLQVDTKAEAAVYFGEDGRARVLYRDGKIQPLAASPYLNNLAPCVIYLDEAHTRGVDLKMPADAVAALTLGVMQTKDHTVQAAMRLRQLAISQSIIFFAPPEVHQSIQNLRRKSDRDSIDSRDVIIWLLEQTCCNIEQLQPLYISQGLEYCRRRLYGQKYPDAALEHDQRKAYLKLMEQPEQYSLEKLYAPDQKLKARPIEAKGFPEVAGYVEKLNALKIGLHDTSDTVQALAHQEVEQEREVEVEVETVREVKKPSHAQALPQPALQQHVRSFAETGRLSAGSCQQAFISLQHTALGRRLGISDSATKSRVFVTQDFDSTIVTEWRKPRDEYVRPVHWILWSEITATALIISDYEADAVLPLIRDRHPYSTHLITYAAPVSKAMLIFDTLKFYSVPCLPDTWRAPAWLVRDLGIFAGRLYFDIADQSQAVYEALGLPSPAPIAGNEPPPITEVDLLAQLPFQEEQQEEERPEAFSKAPLLFMQEWLAIRRKGQDFAQTMMGEICRGRRLEIDESKKVEEGEEEGEEEMEELLEEAVDQEM